MVDVYKAWIAKYPMVSIEVTNENGKRYSLSIYLKSVYTVLELATTPRSPRELAQTTFLYV